MASNVVRNRKWIEDTYSAGTVSNACQKWVDDNPDKKTQDEIAAGLLSVMKRSRGCGFGQTQQAPLGRRL